MEAPTCEASEGLPGELLYTGDLVLVAESLGKLKQKELRWKECTGGKRLKINISKTR